MLDEQASGILDTSDPLAERALAGRTTTRSLGYPARLFTIADYEAEDVAQDAMLAELMEDNIALAASMRPAHKLCDELEDVPWQAFWKGTLTLPRSGRGSCARPHDRADRRRMRCAESPKQDAASPK
jgi:DNA-binding ferritin-like protein